MSERFTVTASIANGPTGALRLTVLAARPEDAFVVAPTVLTVTMWRDGGDIVRIALHHRNSRSLAYVQGNRALLELCGQIRLQLVPIEQDLT